MEGEKIHEDAQIKEVISNNINEDCDELLQKISEVVKDENMSSKTLDEISKSSERDFLKKIEEIENEEKIKTIELNKENQKDEGVIVINDLIINMDEKILDEKHIKSINNCIELKSTDNVPTNLTNPTKPIDNQIGAKNESKIEKSNNTSLVNELLLESKESLSEKTNEVENLKIDKMQEENANEKTCSDDVEIKLNNLESKSVDIEIKKLDEKTTFNINENNVNEIDAQNIDEKLDEIEEKLAAFESEDTDKKIENDKNNVKTNKMVQLSNVEPMSVETIENLNNIEEMETNVDEIESNALEDVEMKEISNNSEVSKKLEEKSIFISDKEKTIPASDKIQNQSKSDTKPTNTENDLKTNEVKEKIQNEKPENQKKSDDTLDCNEQKIEANSLVETNKIIKVDCEKTVPVIKISKDLSEVEVNKNNSTIDNEIPKPENGKSFTPQNKILSSLKNDHPNTPVSTTNVFNSTPIQKQFEISSENVSKISDVESSHNTSNIDEKSPNKADYHSTDTLSGACTTCDSENQKSDEIDKFVKLCKNGIVDTSTSNEDDKNIDSLPIKSGVDILLPSKIKPISHEDENQIKNESEYEITYCSDQNHIKYFLIEELGINKSVFLEKSSSISSDQSSYGSVTSLTPHALPQIHAVHSSELSSSSGSQCSIVPTSKKVKKQFKNKIDLCTFVIEHFTQIKKHLTTDIKEKSTNDIKPPSTETVTISSNKKGSRKRSLNTSQIETESNDVPKAKQAKKEETVKEEQGEIVLAKWVDKKYYAGRILNEKPGNKYAILFEDGASKTLPKDSIVFGENGQLPLLNQYVYALIDDDDYECGLVESIDKQNNVVLYTVKTDKKTVQVNPSGIYLQESQAKAIQKKSSADESFEESIASPYSSRATRNKRTSQSPVVPEAGFSGLSKSGNKRQKRRLTQTNYINPRKHSESESTSDILNESPSPEPALEAVEGVQPEVQKTDSESEICRMIFLTDLKAVDSTIDVNNMLGPLPKLCNIFRNRHFLLTCTVGLKPHRYDEMKMLGENFKNRQFSKVPFVKTYLKKQLEMGGAKVYEHFEDIPKSKYRQCKLISSRPCITAKYVQCISADIQMISHEWVIDSCRQNQLIDFIDYVLPVGWSITKTIFIKHDQRATKKPFSKTNILLASEHKDFIQYWSRVCKLAGADILLIKSLNDITETLRGFMVADMDFPQNIKNKAEHFGIPVVSTVWIVESLILGKTCATITNPTLLETYQDDDF